MYLSKYGVARHIYIAIPKAGSANHAASGDWTPAAGDVKISKDGGAAANVTNLPTSITMGNSTLWDFSLTAAEMQAAQIVVTVSDSATKAVDDTGFSIETYGHASAQHAFDFGTASTAQTGDAYAVVNSGTHGNAALKALIDAIDDYVDTEVAAIKAKTDALPADPADASDLAALFTALQSHGDATWATATGFSTLDAAGVRAALGLASANLDTQLAALPTADENADALIGRNIEGGSSTGRTVAQALAFLRNKWEVSGATLTVYGVDDSTPSWAASVTQTAGNPISAVDPT